MTKMLKNSILLLSVSTLLSLIVGQFVFYLENKLKTNRSRLEQIDLRFDLTCNIYIFSFCFEISTILDSHRIPVAIVNSL